jgi:SWI/SNF-related matrix-associated actin-dependent regulator of chromatin subfamily A3
MLDLVTTNYLHSLGVFEGLSFTAVISTSSLAKVRKPTRSSTIVDITVNIMGPERIADGVGATLAHASAYLQHPFFLPTGIKYVNPQYFYSEGEPMDLSHLIGPLRIDSSSIRVSQGVEKLLGSLDDSSPHPALRNNQSVSLAVGNGLFLTPLKMYGLSVDFKYILLI